MKKWKGKVALGISPSFMSQIQNIIGYFYDAELFMQRSQ